MATGDTKLESNYALAKAFKTSQQLYLSLSVASSLAQNNFTINLLPRNRPHSDQFFLKMYGLAEMESKVLSKCIVDMMPLV